MTSKEIVKQTLEGWRYPILQEEEHSVLLRYQMNYVQIGSLQENSHAIAVTLSGLFSADDDHEVALAIKACNELNYRLMQVKLYLDGDNDLVIASEFFYNNDDDVAYLLDIALSAVVSAKKQFLKQYEAAVEEDRLMQELDESSPED